MAYPIQCSCSKLQGSLERAAGAHRCICYCADCQVFARYLGRDAGILDAAGGTDIVQSLPKYLAFTAGDRASGLHAPHPERLVAPVCRVLQHAHRQYPRQRQALFRRFDPQLPGCRARRLGSVRIRVNTMHAKGPLQQKAMGLLHCHLLAAAHVYTASMYAGHGAAAPGASDQAYAHDGGNAASL